MQIAYVNAGRTVAIGSTRGKFLRMCGTDALVELDDGRRVLWSGALDVDILTDAEEIEENSIPRLEAELQRLESFTEGKWAKLGEIVETPCTEVDKKFHVFFVKAALGDPPEGAVVCRRCTKKLCVRPDHLFWGTRSDCQRNMVLQGVARPGGKSVSRFEVAAAIIRTRLRLTRMRAKLISRSGVSDI